MDLSSDDTLVLARTPLADSRPQVAQLGGKAASFGACSDPIASIAARAVVLVRHGMPIPHHVRRRIQASEAGLACRPDGPIVLRAAAREMGNARIWPDGTRADESGSVQLIGQDPVRRLSPVDAVVESGFLGGGRTGRKFRSSWPAASPWDSGTAHAHAHLLRSIRAPCHRETVDGRWAVLPGFACGTCMALEWWRRQPGRRSPRPRLAHRARPRVPGQSVCRASDVEHERFVTPVYRVE
jgi:hypothetical protein